MTLFARLGPPKIEYAGNLDYWFPLILATVVIFLIWLLFKKDVIPAFIYTGIMGLFLGWFLASLGLCALQYWISFGLFFPSSVILITLIVTLAIGLIGCLNPISHRKILMTILAATLFSFLLFSSIPIVS